MKLSLFCLFALVGAIRAIDKQALWDSEQAMFFDGKSRYRENMIADITDMGGLEGTSESLG
jgi:hypothetical protein